MHALLVVSGGDEAAMLPLVLQRSGLALPSAGSIERSVQSWPESAADLVQAAPTADTPRCTGTARPLRDGSALATVVDSFQEDLYYALPEAGAGMVIRRLFSALLPAAQMREPLRRAGGVPLTTLPTPGVSGLILDPASHCALLSDGAPQRLTHFEFRLPYISDDPPRPGVAHGHHVRRVWGQAEDCGGGDSVRGLVSRPRARVEPSPREPQLLRAASAGPARSTLRTPSRV